jgi:hypothetical protein
MNVQSLTRARIARAVLGERTVWLAKETAFTRMPSKPATRLANLSGLYWPPEVAARRTLFIHIPRTAGTSITRALYGNNLFMHHSASYFKAIDQEIFRSSFKFSVVRNPWDRLVSAYHLFKVGHGDMGKVWNAERYTAIRDMNFDQFVAEWLWPRRNRSSLDICFWPQTYFTHSRDGGMEKCWLIPSADGKILKLI